MKRKEDAIKNILEQFFLDKKEYELKTLKEEDDDEWIILKN